MTPLGNKLVGEITLRGILCGKRYFAEVLMRTLLGIPLISYVGEFDELGWGLTVLAPLGILKLDSEGS